MSIASINHSLTGAVNITLKNSLREAENASQALATGKRILHYYMDPTGAAIGQAMQRDEGNLRVILTGINQTEQVLYMVEDAYKNMSSLVEKMSNVLTRARTAFMSDKMVAETLSETYKQYAQELDRIASSVNYNGEYILNGKGGKQASPIAATVANDFSKANITLDSIGSISGFEAKIGGADSAKTATITNGTPAISGGSYIKNEDGSIVGTRTTIIIKGATVTNSDGTTVADVELNNVKVSVANDGKATLDLSEANLTVRGDNISEVSPQELKASDVSDAKIDGVISSTQGGSAGSSTFNFTTGLGKDDVLKVSFPNLISKDFINTLNGIEISPTGQAPTGFSDLQTVADAERDINIINAYATQLTKFASDLGALQSRFTAMGEQLSTSLEQYTQARSAITDADLPGEAEKSSRQSVKINIAIAQLHKLNQITEQLQKIITG